MGRYEILGEFFDSLDSSIRLLRLKGSTPTFTNICPKIESLTDRYFYLFVSYLKFSLIFWVSFLRLVAEKMKNRDGK
jgi:chromatin licensing and DNA replication factor 1